MRIFARLFLLPLFLGSSVLIFCGMEVMQYREELGTLKEHASNEGERKKFEKSQENSFQAVDKAVKSKKISVGTTTADFLNRFGAPNAKDSSENGQRWLYRSIHGKALEKPWIFFYFDPQGKLLRWECGHTVCD